MTAFVEKLVAEIVVNLCVGVVLALIFPLLSTPDEVVRQNRRLMRHRCGSNASMEVASDRVRPGDQRQESALR